MTNLAEVIKKGNRRESLIAIRNRIASELDSAKYAKDVPPLAKQLVEVIEQIDALPEPGKVDAVDELEQAREARRASAHQDGAPVLDERGSGGGRARRKRGAGPG